MASSSRSKSATLAKLKDKRQQRNTRSKGTAADFIDDMAEESNGENGGAYSSELSEAPDNDLSNFIVPDGDEDAEPGPAEPSANEDVTNDPSDVETGSPIVPRTPKKPKKVVWVQFEILASFGLNMLSFSSPSVVNTSGEEEITALDADDSMFNKGSGVKASTLPPGLVTRSKRKKGTRSSTGSVEFVSTTSKKAKVTSPTPDDDSDDFPNASQLLALSPKTPSKPPAKPRGGGKKKAVYMAKLMAEQMPLMTQTVMQALSPALESSVSKSEAILNEMKSIVSGITPPKAVQSLDPSAMPGSPRKAGSADPIMEVDDEFASSSSKPKFVSYSRTGKGKEREIVSPVGAPLLNDMFAAEVPNPSAQNVPQPAKGSADREQPSANAAPNSIKAGAVSLPNMFDDADAAQHSQHNPKQTLSSSTATATNKPCEKGPAKAESALVLDSLFTAPDEVTTEPGPPVDLLKDAIPFDEKSAKEQVFLEDIETDKPPKYNPSAPCGVFDEDIQDPLLVPLYKGLPGLPAGRFVYPSYMQQAYVLEEGLKGGHMQFSAWGRILGKPSNCRRITMESSLTFERDGQYMNPVRNTPAIMQIKPTGPGSASLRVNIQSKVAICVSAGMLTESFLMEPQTSGAGLNARQRKLLALMLYNQDWERWESFMCTVFCELFMYSPMSGMALHIGSRLNDPNPNEKRHTKNREDLEKSQDAFSPIRSRTSSPAKRVPPGYFQNASGVKYSYKHDDTIPIYDATDRDFNFHTDLPNLNNNLPLWQGEIPVRSFVVAGYTASSYRGNGGGKPNQIHVGCNLMWAICPAFYVLIRVMVGLKLRS
ncbi:hypothetical protein C8R43DRAFT_945362 [Mycena crocata]|nr:hypothetical protein C8R43DRAFT_945362 [Mycena crocata]